jgi:tetratricopeptide (TPR) repeat protein
VVERRWPAALRLLEEALIKFPEVTALYKFRSEAYLGLRKFDEALEDARKLLEIEPNSADVSFQKFESFFKLFYIF